jgi:4-hydroxybenzoyl-CoA thioesterase
VSSTVEASGAGLRVTTTRRLTMGDVDAIQVYAPNYFRWMDQGIHELFAALGHPVSQFLAEGNGTPAVDAGCQYFAPVTLDEVLECTTYVSRVGTSSFDLTHEFRCDGRAVARGSMTHVWIEIRDGVQFAVPVPGWLREAAATDAPGTDSPGTDAPESAALPGVSYGECPVCARIAFPTERSCLVCGAEPAERRSGAHAVLTTWTTVHQAPPEFETPYVLGWVELTEPALAVMGRFEGAAAADGLQAGTAVRVSTVEEPAGHPGGVVLLEVAP